MGNVEQLGFGYLDGIVEIPFATAKGLSAGLLVQSSFETIPSCQSGRRSLRNIPSVAFKYLPRVRSRDVCIAVPNSCRTSINIGLYTTI